MKIKNLFLVLSIAVIVANGENLLYREDGTLKEKANYQNGLLNGLRYEYFENGKTIKKITSYKDGKKSGMEKFYDKLGILRDFKEN